MNPSIAHVAWMALGTARLGACDHFARVVKEVLPRLNTVSQRRLIENLFYHQTFTRTAVAERYRSRHGEDPPEVLLVRDQVGREERRRVLQEPSGQGTASLRLTPSNTGADAPSCDGPAPRYRLPWAELLRKAFASRHTSLVRRLQPLSTRRITQGGHMRKHRFAGWLLLTLAVAPGVASAGTFDTPTVTGAIGPGTVYGIWVPPNWNGDLVLYAHGFRNPNCPLAIPTTPEASCAPLPGLPATDSGTPQAVKPMRDVLLSLGYAFAASSYSDTALALKEGAQQTLQLKGIFASRFGMPARTWLYGHSMGGAIVVKLAEQHPGAFDGALAACGMISGSPMQFQYVADGRATLDAIFPGVVPGGVADVPAGLTFYGDVAPRVMALFDSRNPAAPSNFAKAMAWAKIDQVGFEFDSPPELVKGILELLYFQTLGTAKLLAAAHGIPVDNTGVTYSGPPIVGMLGVDLAYVNQVAERVASDPQAVNFAEHYYDSTGALGIPLITLHTKADAAVPKRHELAYWAKAKGALMDHLLVRRTVDHSTPDGHCTFTLEEELAAFSDLVSWVETGIRPAGEPPPAP